jgi:hypothetical protein
MFYIKSYILKPKVLIYDLNDANINPEKYFIDISEKEKILQIIKKIDFDYLEGVIYLKYDEEIIFDFKYWDLVDQLWAYFLNMIEEYYKNGYVKYSFPDQPINLFFNKAENGLILFKVEANSKRNWLLPQYDFFKMILKNAKYFFEKMDEYLLIRKKKDFYKSELDKIERLDKVVGYF